MDSIRSALHSIRDPLAWLPDPVVAVIILALAAGIAYAVHMSLSRLLRRLLAGRYPTILSMFTQTRGVSRMALLILAIIIAIPVAPIPYDTAALLARVLSIAIIGLVGWAAITRSISPPIFICGGFASTPRTICWRASISRKFACCCAPPTCWW